VQGTVHHVGQKIIEGNLYLVLNQTAWKHGAKAIGIIS
jgi:hypothetical protein